MTEWATGYPSLAATWAASSDLTKEYIQKFPGVTDAWKAKNPSATDEPKPEDLAPAFFELFAKAHPGKFPCTVEVEKGKKEIRPDDKGDDIRSIFFDLWLQDPAHREQPADIEPVPADLVLTSGSGLDPDITLRNAKSVYQLDRVAAKRGVGREQLLRLLEEHAFSPLGGLAGEPLVNVLEVNLELDRQFPVPAAK